VRRTPASIDCYERNCSSDATERRLVEVGGRLEELWTCPAHAVTCLARGCGREATERILLHRDGRLELLSACPVHGTTPFTSRPPRPRRPLLRRPA
jgi:hypothetical protein